MEFKIALFECKNCGKLILPWDNLTYGCPNCESKNIGEYNGVIGQYSRQLNSEDKPNK